MKKHIISSLCLSLLLAASTVRSQEVADPVSQLTQTIDEALFAPTPGLSLTHEEISLLTNATLLLYMEAHYILRSHTSTLSPETEHRKQVIEKTRGACLGYIYEHGSENLKVAVNLLNHNTQSLKRTYLGKYQEELISGERDTFVHAQALQQVSASLFGIWYKTLYEGMEHNSFEEGCFKIAFNQDGIIPELARAGELPSPSSIM